MLTEYLSVKKCGAEEDYLFQNMKHLILLGNQRRRALPANNLELNPKGPKLLFYLQCKIAVFKCS